MHIFNDLIGLDAVLLLQDPDCAVHILLRGKRYKEAVVYDGLRRVAVGLHIGRIVFELHVDLLQGGDDHKGTKILHTGALFEMDLYKIRKLAVRASCQFLVDGGDSLFICGRCGGSGRCLRRCVLRRRLTGRTDFFQKTINTFND